MKIKKSVLKKCEEKLLEMQEAIENTFRAAKNDFKSDQDVQDEGDTAQEMTTQSVSMSLAESNKVRLQQIKQALARIKDGTYGLCVDTDEPIEEKRLLVNPLALRTIMAQEAFEREEKAARIRRRGAGGEEI